MSENFSSSSRRYPPLKVGIYALQETKSTQTDCLKFPKVHFYFSGSSQDPHAGVGFAIPTPLIPLVYDFHPWSSRIAVLILNTRPLRTALFSIYAPSQTQDSTFDHQRKTQFWNNLRTVYQTYSAEYTVIMMGTSTLDCTRTWSRDSRNTLGTPCSAPVSMTNSRTPTTFTFFLIFFLKTICASCQRGAHVQYPN